MQLYLLSSRRRGGSIVHIIKYKEQSNISIATENTAILITQYFDFSQFYKSVLCRLQFNYVFTSCLPKIHDSKSIGCVKMSAFIRRLYQLPVLFDTEKDILKDIQKISQFLSCHLLLRISLRLSHFLSRCYRAFKINQLYLANEIDSRSVECVKLLEFKRKSPQFATISFDRKY